MNHHYLDESLEFLGRNLLKFNNHRFLVLLLLKLYREQFFQVKIKIKKNIRMDPLQIQNFYQTDYLLLLHKYLLIYLNYRIYFLGRHWQAKNIILIVLI